MTEKQKFENAVGVALAEITSPRGLAIQLAEMDCNAQALFLIEFGKAVETWKEPGAKSMQAHWIGRRLHAIVRESDGPDFDGAYRGAEFFREMLEAYSEDL